MEKKEIHNTQTHSRKMSFLKLKAFFNTKKNKKNVEKKLINKNPDTFRFTLK